MGESEGVEQVTHRHAEHFGLRRIATVDDLPVSHAQVHLVRHVQVHRPAEELDVFLLPGENAPGGSESGTADLEAGLGVNELVVDTQADVVHQHAARHIHEDV